MTKTTSVILALALTWLISSPVLAESDVSVKLRQRIELDLVDAVPADVFGTFAKIFGAQLDLSSAVSGKISIRLHNVTAETALSAVCESIGCRSELQSGVTPVLRIVPIESKASEVREQAFRESLDSPMSISLKDAAAKDVLASISRMLEADLQVQEGTSKTVTLELQDVPARQALDAVGALIGMDWELREARVDGRIQRILKVSPRNSIRPSGTNGVSPEKS